MWNESLFIIINFIVSFLSDVFLNILSNKPYSDMHNLKIILSLRSYFKDKSMILSGVYAGFTVIFALIVNMILFKVIYGLYIPRNVRELFFFLLIAFPLGYIVDILIEKYKIFGNTLDEYYKDAGAGFWGAVAFIMSIMISYGIQSLL